jgi:hypothetical protein
MVFVVCCVLYLLFWLFVCATTEPGVYPRRSSVIQQCNEIQVSEDKEIEELNVTTASPPLYSVVNMNGVETRLKYCNICMIYRPAMTSHCKKCDNCVEQFDHHCPWTGTCIGKRLVTTYCIKSKLLTIHISETMQHFIIFLQVLHFHYCLQ